MSFPNVYGFEEDGSDHDKALRQLMLKAKERNCKFNPEKFVVKKLEIPFYGHIISKNGIKQDLEANLKMQSPKDKKQLTSFLGQINYLNKFSPQLAALTTLLCDLISTKNDFTWSSHQQRVFVKVKEEIWKTTILRYFDLKEPIVLQTDASTAGIDAALL